MLYPIELRARTSAAGMSGGEERIRTSGPVLPDQPLSRRLPSATRPPLQDAPAEGVGFEPTELSLSGFQDRRLKPLGHPSARTPSERAVGDNSGSNPRVQVAGARRSGAASDAYGPSPRPAPCS